MKINWKLLVSSIIICELAGIIGSIFTSSSIPTWYALLSKPSFSPPNWVFAPVWTILYALIGISAYLIYASKSRHKNRALFVFGAQLVLNALWSIVFFGSRSISGGLYIIIAMWLLIMATILMFYKIDKRAAYLLVPYLLWVSVASILNYYILILN